MCIYIGLFGESRTEPGILQHAVAVVTQVVGTWDSDTCASVYSHVQPQKLVCRDEAFPCGRGTFRKSRRRNTCASIRAGLIRLCATHPECCDAAARQEHRHG